MVQPRLEIQSTLETLVASKDSGIKVYYNPSSQVHLHYPCVLYSLSNIVDFHADNKRYRSLYRYTIQLLTRNSDPNLDSFLNAFDHISFDRVYEIDGIYHYTFNLIY